MEADGGPLEIRASSPEDLDAVYKELRGKAGITAEFVSSPSEPGYQGGEVALLTVALSSGAATAFFQLIKSLVESRGPGFKLSMRRGKEKVEITAEDAEEALSLLRELTGGQ